MKRDILRFGLVGAGMVSDAHVRSIRETEGAELRIIFSRTEARAKALAEKYNLPWTSDLGSVLKSSDLDALIITTAPYNHAPHAIAAMEAGKHVLVEKPMAVSTKECDRMIAVSETTRRTLGVVCQNRLKRGARRVKQFIDQGRLGGLLHLSGYVKWYRPQSYYEANDWRGVRKREGGGVIFSQAGHTLDLLRWFGGPIEWVFANAVTAPIHTGIDIETLAAVTLRFENGATGLLEASTSLYPGSAERIEIHGSRGTLVLESGNIEKWEILDPGPEDEPGDTREETGTGASDPMAFPITWHRGILADFVQAVKEQRPPVVDGSQGRLLNEMCDAIYESAKSLAIVRMG